MSARLVIATALPGATGELAWAAALAVGAAPAPDDGATGGSVVVEVGASRARGPTILASASARGLEALLRAEQVPAAARGAICWVSVAAAEPEPLARLGEVLRIVREQASALIACLPAALWRPALEDDALAVSAALLRAELPAGRPLAALAARELIAAGVRARIVSRGPGAVATRRALAGLDPGGATGERARRLAAAMLGPRPALPVSPPLAGRPLAPRWGAPAASSETTPFGERGQALPAILGAALVTIAVALALVALGGAVTGAARAQRVADLAAVSAARSMRDDHPRLFVPALLADGRPNPRHLARDAYLERAREAAREAAARNGADPARLAIGFPDQASFAPIRARVALRAELGLPRPAPGDEQAADRAPVEAAAEATLSPPAAAALDPAGGSAAPEGDEYRGPFAVRQGRAMRPDVAAAFDRLAAAAGHAGIALSIASAHRSNAEQARLFARNPDPRWVAPPGRSLHRCGTELDLGPPPAYAWLAANAPRFGFVRRYPWEPWHFGYDRGPAPCSARSGHRPAHGAGDGRQAAAGLPDFVPARFRPAIAAASSRHDVSAALLAAQLLAESNFNPFAVSPAGAEGIAQFMPATAAAYGLADPFDPAAAIDAQARLMSDHLRRFGSIALALAAYNAGPAPVETCSCVPPYPETEAYVARILGLLGGAGELPAPPLEVRLVA